jgi:hypothetical protein
MLEQLCPGMDTSMRQARYCSHALFIIKLSLLFFVLLLSYADVGTLTICQHQLACRRVQKQTIDALRTVLQSLQG